MPPLKSLLVLVALLLAACTAGTDDAREQPPADPGVPSSSEGEAYDTYTNDRFGFSVAYPAARFTSTEHSQNGDGAVLSSPSETITLRAYASHNASGNTLTDIVEATREEFMDVEAEESRRTYAILRGTNPDGDRLVRRIALQDDVFYHLSLSYPEGALDDRTVGRILASHTLTSDNKPADLLVKVALLDYAAAGDRYGQESTGQQQGCDRVVLVERDVPWTQAPLKAALEELFSLDQFEIDGWQNFIAKTNGTLSFERAVVEDGVASIYLNGELSGLAGVCDDPRARIQITETALQFPTVDSVALYVNGRRTDLQPDARSGDAF
jgi:hypothetical protein